MSKILELREKRAKVWEAAKAFLDSKRGNDGLLSPEDTATYEKNGSRRYCAGQRNRTSRTSGCHRFGIVKTVEYSYYRQTHFHIWQQ